MRHFIFILSSRPLALTVKTKKNRFFFYKTLCSQQMLKCKDGQINKQSSILIIHFFFYLNKYMYQSAVQVSRVYLKHFFKISLQHKKLSNLFFLLIIKGHDCQPIFSSPEPKAHGELIVYRSIRRPSVRPSVSLHKQMGTPVAIKFGQLDTQVVIFEYKCDLFRKFDT